MNLYGYKKTLFSFAVLTLLTLSGCGNGSLRKEVNVFLRANGWEEIQSGSKEEINSQLATVLINHNFGRDDGNDEQQKGVADFIVENELYGTANNILLTNYFYNDSNAYDLIFKIVLMVDEMSEKKSESADFLKNFHQSELTHKANIFLRKNSWEEIRIGSKEEINSHLANVLIKNTFGTGFGFGSDAVQKKNQDRVVDFIVENEFYGAANNILLSNYFYRDSNAFNLIFKIVLMVDEMSEKEFESVEFLKNFYKKAEGLSWDYRNGAFLIAVQKSSKEFKKELIERLKIEKALPLSLSENILPDFIPSDPKKGKYALFSNSKKGKQQHFEKQYLSGYATETLFPASYLKEAQIIIYEICYNERIYGYGSMPVYLVHTNVKVVNAVTGKTIFNKTYKTKRHQQYVYMDGDTEIIDDNYEQIEYAKQISEIVKNDL